MMPAKIIAAANGRFEGLKKVFSEFFGTFWNFFEFFGIFSKLKNILVAFFGVKQSEKNSYWLDHAHLKNLDLSQLKEGKKTQNLKRALEEISEHIRNVKKRFGSEVLRKLKFERFNFFIKILFINN